MRLWHQSMTEIDGLAGYRQRLESHAAQLFSDRPDVTVDVHGLAPGSYRGAAPTDVLGSPDVHHQVAQQSLAAAQQAERDGYDAFVVGSFSEALLWPTREAVGIPVVSLTESTLLTACSLGRRVVFVANAPSIADIVTASVTAHGLAVRSAGAYALDPALTEPELMSDPGGVVTAFTTQVRALLAATGADVVVPAEGVMCEILYEAGRRDIDGAVVLDSVGITWRHAVYLVEVARDRT